MSHTIITTDGKVHAGDNLLAVLDDTEVGKTAIIIHCRVSSKDLIRYTHQFLSSLGARHPDEVVAAIFMYLEQQGELAPDPHHHND